MRLAEEYVPLVTKTNGISLFHRDFKMNDLLK